MSGGTSGGTGGGTGGAGGTSRPSGAGGTGGAGRRSFRQLEGQVAVVTGAARGVGELLARKLSARGAKVALVGLEAAELKRVAGRLHAECDHWYADVTDATAMARVAAEVEQRFGRVDIVVANAGVASGGPFEHSDPDAWRRVIEVNLIGGAVTARAFLPALRRNRGYFLQIASLAAMTPAPMMTAYCASKSGVEAFAHSLRGEVAHQGVRVGVGYLSWTDTDMVRGADRDAAMRELRRRLPWPANRTYPLGPAVDRLVAGIERRAPHVYAQWWLRGTQGVRGYLPGVIATVGRREMRRLEPRLGDVTKGLVGAGGEADERDRTLGN
ncbi:MULTISPECIES: SDR family oxidoreductase [unclassified Streptomyces]|uniref:SDR family oxidoreductase n=1 Tax=unclassified Streptomyces TaxID=2593676 RepID=UPI002E2BF854|nr:SDR family oxidoreductase [Streptomyces sp. NBC_01429]